MKREEQKPEARSADLVVNELLDEVLVYDLNRHKAHCLNKTAAIVWKNCDGRTTISKMASLLEKDLKTPVSEEVIWLALDSLGRAHLLQGRVTRPSDTMRLSRREMVRLGLATALSLPLVTSISSPVAAQAGTVPVLKATNTGQCQGANGKAEKGCCCEGTGKGLGKICCEDPANPGQFACVGGPCVQDNINPGGGVCDPTLC